MSNQSKMFLLFCAIFNYRILVHFYFPVFFFISYVPYHYDLNELATYVLSETEILTLIERNHI